MVALFSLVCNIFPAESGEARRKVAADTHGRPAADFPSATAGHKQNFRNSSFVTVCFRRLAENYSKADGTSSDHEPRTPPAGFSQPFRFEAQAPCEFPHFFNLLGGNSWESKAVAYSRGELAPVH